MFLEINRNFSILTLCFASVSTLAAEAAMERVVAPRVDVIGMREQLSQLPSSATKIEQEELQSSHVFTTNEALRKVPGLVLRDEEGFGMRPNIAVRGLNPTRSTKVLLLEDGIPLTYAPYGANESYYHPAIDRFSSIEVLKGSSQIKFGPLTAGGVINYITPSAPENYGGYLGITGGNRDYLNTKINVGGKGALADYTHKQGDGARDKTNSNIEDLNFKFTRELNEQQAITLRTNWFNESSQVSYSGVTQREYQNFGGEYNPFNHDRFDTNRYGLSATHDWAINSEISLTTNVYYSYFERDWWRQQSNTTAGNISAGTGCAAFAANRINGVALSGDTCQGVQGRLRTYNAYGVEPRLSVTHAWGELELGAKVHYEDQERRQVNGTSPTARTGALAENNERKTEAYSGFVSNRFDIGKFSLTPAIRYENIKNQRSNRLTGANGDSILTEWIPGVGLAYNPHPQLTVFAGVHRGFAPPRTEDLISNAGGAIDVSAERSTNWELGFRTQPSAKLNIEATAFYNDFKNLIAVGSVASNVNLSQGQATFAGVELNGKYDFDHGFYSRLALTWLPKADQDKPFREVVAGTVVAGSAAGNRQPYAPKQTITAAFGYKMGAWDTQLEAVHVGKQYSDFAETKDVPNTALGLTGQIGEIASYTVFNAALNYRYEPYKATFFITGKNLFDREYIVDRTRGILTGMPRLIQAGMRYDF